MCFCVDVVSYNPARRPSYITAPQLLNSLQEGYVSMGSRLSMQITPPISLRDVSTANVRISQNELLHGEAVVLG